MVSNIFLCAYWPSVCFLWKNVYSYLLPIFYLGSILKEISPGCSLDGLMLKLKLQYLGYLMWRADTFEKTLMLWNDWAKAEKGRTEDDRAGWHHWLNGHEFGWTLGVGDGQGGLACCSSWGSKESGTTEWLNWSWYILKIKYISITLYFYSSIYTFKVFEIIFYIFPFAYSSTVYYRYKFFYYFCHLMILLAL